MFKMSHFAVGKNSQFNAFCPLKNHKFEQARCSTVAKKIPASFKSWI